MSGILEITESGQVLEIIENLLEQCAVKEDRIRQLESQLQQLSAGLTQKIPPKAEEKHIIEVQKIDSAVLEAEGNPQGILIVDSSDVMRLLLKGLLVANNHEVVGSVKSIDEAITVLKKIKPAIAILELDTPMLECFNLARKIKSTYSETVIILISSEQDREIINQAKRAGADDFFTKPIDSKILLEAIVKHLGNSAGN